MTAGTDVSGRECGAASGQAKAIPEDTLIAELSGNTLQMTDAAFNTDLEIDTFEPVKP